jgi:hypothetical protein
MMLTYLLFLASLLLLASLLMQVLLLATLPVLLLHHAVAGLPSAVDVCDVHIASPAVHPTVANVIVVL